jgi:hypothetical protein
LHSEQEDPVQTNLLIVLVPACPGQGLTLKSLHSEQENPVQTNLLIVLVPACPG